MVSRNDSLRYGGTGASAGGMGLGALIGGLTAGPAGIAAGMAAGSAGGGLINAILGLFQEPEIPEIPAGQLQSAGIMGYTTGKLAAQRGLSAQGVRDISQLGSEEQTNMVLMANTAAQNLSAYDRKRIFDWLMAESSKVETNLSKKIAAIDPSAEFQRAQTVIGAGKETSSAYDRIRQARLQKKMLEDKYVAGINQSFMNSVLNLAKGAQTAVDLWPTATPETTSSTIDTSAYAASADASKANVEEMKASMEAGKLFQNQATSSDKPADEYALAEKWRKDFGYPSWLMPPEESALAGGI